MSRFPPVGFYEWVSWKLPSRHSTLDGERERDPMPGLDPSLIGEFAAWYAVFLFSLTLHEGAHALVAWLGGDPTAYQGGQVTANPLPHIRREPVGTVLVPVLSWIVAGWVMGWASTPYDPHWADRHPRRHALMSLAGPVANLSLALVALVTLRILLAAGVYQAPDQAGFSRLVALSPELPEGSLLGPLGLLLSVAVTLNLLLGIFNLIPLPPLDGAGVVQGLAPGGGGRLYLMLRSNPMMGLLGLLLAWRLMGLVVGPVFSMLLRVLHPGALYS
jgi:Zn-dependent protease